MPAVPAWVDLADFKAGVIKGIYRFEPPADVSQVDAISSSTPQDTPRQATILFSGSAHQAARAARESLAKNWGISVDTWSVTSYKALREEALEAERYSRLHPGEAERVPYVTSVLADSMGPIVAVSDFMKMVPDQIARFVPGRFVSLGADSFGRSDTRERLRRFFEIDEAAIVIAVLHALYLEDKASASEVKDAIAHYQFETDRIDPTIA